MQMTMREVFNVLKFVQKQEAYDLDTKLKLAGNKKGYSGLHNILAEEALETSDINTDESIPENKNLLNNITSITTKELDANK